MTHRHRDPGSDFPWELIDDLARKFNGIAGAEYDDLFQEGAVECWRMTERGEVPHALRIRSRMSNWLRTLRRQQYGTGEPYYEDEDVHD